MPAIPLPPAADARQFNQRAMSIPEFQVRAHPGAFGANVAEVNYRGNLQLASNIAAAAQTENRMWTQAIGGVMRVAGEVWQRDQRLEAEAKLNDLQLGIQRDHEGSDATGDGSYRTRVLATFDERSQGLIDGAQTPYQAGLFREGLQRLRFQVERSAVSAEVAGMRQARLDNLNRLVEGAEVEIFRTPGSLEAVRERMLASINDAQLSPSQRSRMLQEVDRRLHMIALERHLISGNIAGAQALMANDRTITALGGLEAVRAQARIQRAAEEARERQEAIDRNTRLLNGTELVDPANPDHRRLISEAFTQSGADRLLASGDANAVVTVAGIARRYGVVPSGAISLLQGMLANGTEQQQIFALQAIASIEQARPGAFANTPLHTTARAEADDFRFLTSGTNGLGLDPATALARIREMRTPEFQARADARRALLTGANGLTSRRTEAELAGIFGDDARAPWFGQSGVGNPRDAGVMLGVYRRAFEFHFLRTGDEAMALAAAREDVRRSYGVTRQSGDGPRIVRSPIELQYPSIDGSHDWIRLQLQEIIRTERGVTIPVTDIFLEANRATEEARGRGGLGAGHPPPYAFHWRVRDARTGEYRYETIPGRLFIPDTAAALRGATERAQAEIDARALAERQSRFGAPLGIPPRRKAPEPGSVTPPRRRTIVRPPTLGEHGRVEVERDSIFDLLGFGARVSGQ